MKRVVIDTDYFKFITNDLTDAGYFLKLMEELMLEPVMHEFVYKQELHEHSLVKQLVKDQKLTVLYYENLMMDSKNCAEYERLFLYAYHEMNGVPYNRQNPIKEYRHGKENLGEIHSLILARLMNYDILMSNDGGAKTLAENKLNRQSIIVHVINIEETFTKLISKENSSFTWTDVRKIISVWKSSGFRADKEKYERVRVCWVTEDK